MTRFHGQFELFELVWSKPRTTLAKPEPAISIYDFEGDWLLLADAILGRAYRNPSANFSEPLHLGNSSITHPDFERAQNNTYTQDWPPHHALANARALMAGYRAWHQFMEKIWRIQ